jgi:hypothetical protein
MRAISGIMRFNQIARHVEEYKNNLAIDALVISLAHPLVFSAGLSIIKDVSILTGIPLHCGIGGCEALRDMYDAKNTGVDAIVAPMIDSTYALEKFSEAINIVFGQSKRNEIKMFVTLSTVDAIRIVKEISDCAAKNKINGININFDECVLSADGMIDYVVELVAKACDEIKMKNIACCVEVSGKHDCIDVCTGNTAVDSVISGILRVKNCFNGDGLIKFIEISKRIKDELFSECGRIAYDFSKSENSERCNDLGAVE